MLRLELMGHWTCLFTGGETDSSDDESEAEGNGDAGADPEFSEDGGSDQEESDKVRQRICSSLVKLALKYKNRLQSA